LLYIQQISRVIEQSKSTRRFAMKKITFSHPPGPSYQRPFGTMQNRAIKKEILNLDPIKDCQRIVYLMVAYEFTNEITNALDIAYLGSGANKYVADILGRSHYLSNGMKRYDDTRFLILKFLECGWDQKHGADAIDQMNMIHSKYPIKNQQYILALCVFMVAPITWIENFGWRKITEIERIAWYQFWANIGIQMKITDFPNSLDEATSLLDNFHTGDEEISQHSEVLGKATLQIFFEKTHRYLKPFSDIYYRSFFTKPILRAYNLKDLPLAVKYSVFFAVKLNSLFRKFFSPGPFPFLVDNQDLLTYKQGKPAIKEVGPTHLKKRINQ